MEAKASEALEKLRFDYLDNVLRNLDQPTWSWPPCMRHPPWKIPLDLHPKSREINLILQKFMDLQRSCSPPMVDCLISRCCFNTAGLMFHYLKAFLDHEAEVKFFIGLYDRNRKIYQEELAHCWLEMNGQIIETSFAYEDDLKMQKFILTAAKKQLYFKLDERDSRMRNWLQRTEEMKWNLKDFKNFSKSDDLIEKHLVFDFTNGHIGQRQRLRVLDELMRKYLLDEFKLDVIDLKKKWNEQCWMCQKKLANLKTCAACRTAKYCGKECQKAYRENDKIFDEKWKSFKKMFG